MKGNFWKKIPAVVAMFATASGFCHYRQKDETQAENEKYDQGHAVEENQMVGAYNAPARIDVEGSWDFFITGSFIFWEPREQGLDIGVNRAGGPGSLAATNAYGEVENFNFKYKPGFKVGLGKHFEHDNWDLYAEYTWLHMSHITSVTADTGANYGLEPSWLAGNNRSTSTLYISGSARWHLHTNILDLELARSYYQGTHLTCRLHFGGRGHIINQKYDVTYVNTDIVSHADNEQTNRVDQDSWGVGPRCGIDASYIFGAGFRFFGHAAASLQYQHFKVTMKQDYYLDVTTLHSHTRNNIGYLTLNPEIGVGFGWGSYFGGNGWHFDLAAGYDLQAFINQNMMRNLNDKANTSFLGSGHIHAIEGDIGNLFFHGLTITARLDF